MPRRQLQLVFTPFVIMMLLAQLILTAGHMHHLAVHSGEHGAAVQLAQGAGGDHPAPFDNDESPCALCWAAAVESRALIPPLPALPLPRAGNGEPLSAAIRASTVQAAPRAFNSRAPPVFLA